MITYIAEVSARCSFKYFINIKTILSIAIFQMLMSVTQAMAGVAMNVLTTLEVTNVFVQKDLRLNPIS